MRLSKEDLVLSLQILSKDYDRYKVAYYRKREGKEIESDNAAGSVEKNKRTDGSSSSSG